MQRPPDIPREAGVFAVLHTATRKAYVNKARNLRERAMLWEYHLKKRDFDPTHNVRVRNFPVHPSDEWTFWGSTTDDLETVQKVFVEKGWTLINEEVRKRQTYPVTYPSGELVDDTLMGHARRLSKPWGAVYKRVERGWTPEQALGLAEPPVLDQRELAIAQMKVRITTDDGQGLLTYDEAVQMRPELGDVRRKIQRFAKKNPTVQEVKLSEIPL
jgi:hypothetical protein